MANNITGFQRMRRLQAAKEEQEAKVLEKENEAVKAKETAKKPAPKKPTNKGAK